MAMIEQANFPWKVSGGIFRGTARPWLGTNASLGIKSNKGNPGRTLGVHRGINLLDFAIGVHSKNNWVDEARKAQGRAS